MKKLRLLFLLSPLPTRTMGFLFGRGLEKSLALFFLIERPLTVRIYEYGVFLVQDSDRSVGGSVANPG